MSAETDAKRATKKEAERAEWLAYAKSLAAGAPPPGPELAARLAILLGVKR